MIAYVMHILYIMHSRMRFELSDRGATMPHVTKKVAQNTRPSFLHVQGKVGPKTNAVKADKPAVRFIKGVIAIYHLVVCT